jgi:hypothetical protein
LIVVVCATFSATGDVGVLNLVLVVGIDYDLRIGNPQVVGVVKLRTIAGAIGWGWILGKGDGGSLDEVELVGL